MAGFATLPDIEALESVPLAERGLAPSTYDLIRRVADAHPAGLALAFFLQASAYQKAVRYSFADLRDRIHQTANMLQDLGLGPEDTVSFILPNLPQTYLVLYGGEAAGIANPLNPLLEAATLADIMNAARTRVLVTLAPFPRTGIWQKVAGIADDVPTLETILQVDLSRYLTGVRKLLARLVAARESARSRPRRARVLDFDKTRARYPTDRLVSGRVIAPDDVAAYFHTGGTTGTPKLAIHTHGNQVFDAWAVTQAIEEKPGRVNFLGLPLFHNYGAIAIGLGMWTSAGGIVIGTPQGYRGEGVIANFWKILGHYQCNLFGAVPTVFKALLNVPPEPEALAALELATCGAAPLPVELARQFTDRFGIPILEGYGLTEATSVCSVNPYAGEKRIGSVGLRLPYQEMRVAHLAGDRFVRFCEPGETGLILLRGPNVFPGYVDPGHNAGIFVDAGDGQGLWLNSGDLGYMDADGYFWLTGRQKELIIRGGHNIDPRQIEEPLHRHPAVALAAAIGRPDAQVGELPVAYVELKPGASADEDDLLAFAREAIGERAAVPRRIHILAEMPLTAVGKIYKPALTRLQVQEVFEAELAQIPGLSAITITPRADLQRGLVMQVQATVQPAVEPGRDPAAVEDAIRQALGQYPVAFELELGA